MPAPQIRRIQKLDVDEINKALRDIQDQLYRPVSTVASGSVPFFAGPHSGRNSKSPQSVPLGALYYETDRNTTYEVRPIQGAAAWGYLAGTMTGSFGQKPAGLGIPDIGFQFLTTTGPQTSVLQIWDGSAWTWAAGIWTDTLANIPTLGPGDVGAIFAASDYMHQWRWDGSGWHFLEGDSSGYIVARNLASAPNGGLWALCDGSTVDVAQDDGSIAAESTPDMKGTATDSVFIMGNDFPFGQVGASPVSWVGGAHTDIEDANHTHDVTIASTGNVYQVGVNQGAGIGGFYTTSIESVAHHHDLTDADAQLNAPNETNGGLPLRVTVVWYYRR